MKQTILILLILTSSLFAEKKVPNAKPEIKPIVDLLTAVKTQNVKLLESVFSKRMVERLSVKPGWKSSLKEYTKVFKKEFGDYSLKDFIFEFQGTDRDKGRINVIYKNKSLAKLSIIKEGELWKMNER